MRTLISIDPGQSGAIAVRDTDGRVFVDNMPDTVADLAEHLSALIPSEMRRDDNDRFIYPHRIHDPLCILEDVGYHVAGNNASASVKFAKHVGTIHGILACWKIPYESVRPQKWQKSFGTLPKDKSERKRRIKELVQRRYPHIKVTLANADALAILLWFTENKKED